jgi:hypothetical protein
MIEAWAIRLLLALAVGAACWFHGYDTGKDRVQAKWDEATVKAERKLIEEKDRLRLAEDKLRSEHAQAIASTNRRLDAAIAGLRDRPDRPAGVSESPRASCTGANGPELARVNAEFLARFAAQAAEQDAALASCYASLDAARKPATQERK